jgi:predicted extracellular nuclease
MRNKLSYSMVFVISITAAPTYADINDIIISEYVEGSSSNKAIELTNIGSTSHTFDDSVSLYYNTGSYQNQIQKADGSNILEGLTIEAGKSLVLLNGEADRDTIEPFIVANGGSLQMAGTYSDVSFNAMNFNGNDSVYLGTDGDTPLDLVGIAGTYDGWDGANQTLRRAADATPSTSFVTSEWTTLDQDTFNGLGAPGATTATVVADSQICTDNSDISKVTVVEIQGTDFSSPMVPEDDSDYTSDEQYRVSGIVAHISDGHRNWEGVYIQDIEAPADRSASDGILVEYSGTAVEVGQQVCFLGNVEESYGRTQFVAEGDAEIENETPVTPRVTDLTVIESDYVCPDDAESCEDSEKELDFGRTYERHEGMLVNLPQDMDSTVEGNQDMRITRTFSFDYDSFRYNMVLSYERVNQHPNQVHVAGSDEAQSLNSENEARRLFIESEESADEGEIPYFPDFNTDPNDNPVLVNDSVTGMVGFIDFSYSEYRLIPTVDVTSDNFTHNIGRSDSPDLDVDLENGEFEIKVASTNVLNFFNSPYGGDENPFGDNRGALTEEEFDRQRGKLAEALYHLDADIIGLMEVENNGFGRDGAISQIVRDVNSKYVNSRYSERDRSESTFNRYHIAAVDSDNNLEIDFYDTIGTDAITNGLIYRPTKVTLKSVDVIQMPRQEAENIVDETTGEVYVDSQGRTASSGSARQRDTLVATFVVNKTGKLLTVAVNHFKSKGSNCIDDWNGWQEWEDFDPSRDDVHDDDFQGQCEHFRNATAVQLGREMDKLSGDKIILGDLNSYAYEEPVLILTDIPSGKVISTAGDTFIGDRPQFGSDTDGIEVTQGFGYVNAVKLKDAEHERESFSYSFNDTVGSLDHILVSPELESRIKDAIDWNINSIESPLFDYSVNRTNNRQIYTDQKGDNPENFFYVDGELTHYRSSDHDPVIVSLAYTYLEAGSDERRFILNSSRIEVPYVAGGDALTGDSIQMTLSPNDNQDMGSVSIATQTFSSDGAQSGLLEVSGLETGSYDVRQVIIRDGTEVESSVQSFEIEVSALSSDLAIVATPEYDGSGGGHMHWLLLGVLGLLSRFRKQQA